MVRDAVEDWDLNQLDFLFVENVGNLVCPSSYDIGEELRVVLRASRAASFSVARSPTRAATR
jgi:hydrogenase nickel incorporation protein HypB